MQPVSPHSTGSGVTRRFAPARTILALVLREMSTRYGKNPGGYAWALFEPLGAILILGIGFSLLLRSPPLGNNFIFFYATGYLPFSLYLNVSGTMSRALSFSRPLLMYPAVTWIDALVARFVLNTITNILIAYILLGALMAITDTQTVLSMQPIVIAMALAALLGAGVGTMNCLLMGLFPVWSIIWSILTRPLFLMSGIILLYEQLPTVARDILWYNPLMHITGLMRQGFFPMYAPQYLSLSFVVFVSMILLALGLLLLRRHNKNILNR